MSNILFFVGVFVLLFMAAVTRDMQSKGAAYMFFAVLVVVAVLTAERLVPHGF